MTNDAHVRRVLIVDDDASFVTLVEAALEKLGVDSEVAPTGADAKRWLSGAQFTCVLLDLRLPDTDGLNVLRDLRQHGNSVPVMVLTTTGSVQAAVQAMKLGAMDFLEKPIAPSDLATVVQRLMAASRRPEWLTHDTGALIDLLARAMVAVCRSTDDVLSVRAWCAFVGRSESSMYALCEMVGVHAKAALDLARLLRAVHCSDARGPRSAFDVADPRTLARMLRRAGVSENAWPASHEALLGNQRLVADQRLIHRLEFHLQRGPWGGL